MINSRYQISVCLEVEHHMIVSDFVVQQSTQAGPDIIRSNFLGKGEKIIKNKYKTVVH